MKNGRVLLVFVAICFLAVACSQPKAPSGTTAPAPAPAAKVTTEQPAQVPDAPSKTDVAPATTEVAQATAAPAVPEPPAPPAEEPAPVAKADDASPVGEQPVVGGTPKLVVPEPNYDFGTLRDSESVTHQFVLRNEGTGTLKITGVRASCGCTTTELEKDTLEPGEEVKVGAVTNLRGRQGAQTKVVTITTNDPETPTVQLRMQGNVTASISVEPDRVNFGEILDDEPREAVVNIKSTIDDLTFTVQSAELTGMDFIQHEIKTVEEGKSYDVIVKTVGKVPAGHHNGRMIIRTDSTERSVIWLSISLQVVGALQIMPPVIHIRYSDKPGEVTSQQLRVSSGRIKEFELLEAVVPVEGMEATLTPAGDNTYLLRLSNIPCSDVLEDKSVILRTNLEDYKEIEIPFNIARVRPPVKPTGTPGQIPTGGLVSLTPEQKQLLRQKAAPVVNKENAAPVPAPAE